MFRHGRWYLEASAGGEDLFEFFSKIVVEPSVEERIGAGAAHADHVAASVGNVHGLCVFAEDIVRVDDDVEDVYGHPAHGEDHGNGHEQVQCFAQALVVLLLL